MPKIIQVDPMGIGNRMLAFLMAKAIQIEVPNAYIEGYDLKDWGQISSERSVLPKNTYRLTHHAAPFGAITGALRSGEISAVRILCPVSRISYYGYLRELASGWLKPAKEVPKGYRDDHLLINIRLGDIVGGLHPDYRPLPISFYEQVVEDTGLAPVFMGQLGGDPYSQELRRRFPRAAFLESGGAFSDFETIRRSKNIVISVSTFSWMAAWLSGEDSRIHMPCAGIFNQRQRPDQELMPNDRRYSFYEFPVSKWLGTSAEMTEAMTTRRQFHSASRARLSFTTDAVQAAINGPIRVMA